METPTNSIPPKHIYSGFVIFWLALILLCLLTFVISMGMMGWGFYTTLQKESKENSPAYAASTATAQWPVVFVDDFKYLSNHWYTGDDTNHGRRDVRLVADGVYRWTLENADGYTYWQPAGVGNFTDFAVSVDVRHTSGSVYDNYGLIFHNSASNFYEFSIQDSKNYSVSVWSADHLNMILPLTYSKAIKPGENNHLTVISEGGAFKLFINDIFVNEFKDNTLVNGEVGLMSNPQNQPVEPESEPQSVSKSSAITGTSLEFDNFEVRAPADVAENLDQPAQLPQIRPEAGLLVFATDRDGNRNIYTISSDGTGLKPLTTDPADDYSPRWSPDGKKIVFCSERDGDPEIYSMDADGGNVTRLTFNPGKDMTPDWSPDGQKIIFSSNRNGKFHIFLMSAQGEKTSISQLTDTKFNETNPTISPDGNRVLYQVKETNIYDLYVMGIDGKNREYVAYGQSSIFYIDGAWSSDGTQIVYVRRTSGLGEIMVGAATKEDGEYQAYPITENKSMNLHPNWSPSGDHIVFVSKVDEQSDIYIILADGDGIFRVTHNEAVEESPDWTTP